MNYPPLGLLWLRFTDPLHGQFAAVTVGLLVLFPLVVRSFARAVGVRVSPVSWVVLFSLVAFAANTHWLLPGFHAVSTGFGSWPAMIASLLGVLCVARALELSRPVLAGVLAGVSVLFNSTVAPGIVVLVAFVLAAGVVGEGRTATEAVRWAAVAGSTALAVCAWWLVPFLHGWERLVEWRVALPAAMAAAERQHLLVVGLTVLLAGCAVLLGRRGRVTAAGLVFVALAAGIADRLGYLRTERWVTPAAVAAIALCAVAAPNLRLSRHKPHTPSPQPEMPRPGSVGAQVTEAPGTTATSGTPVSSTSRGVPVGGDTGLGRSAALTSSVIAVVPAGGETSAAGGAAGQMAHRQDTPPPSPPGGSVGRHRVGPLAAVRRNTVDGRGLFARFSRFRHSPAGGSAGGSRGGRWWVWLVAAGGVAAGVLSGVYAVIPVVVWVVWQRRWAFVRYGAPAWCALLLAVPAAQLFDLPGRPDRTAPSAAMSLTARADEHNAAGFVYLQQFFDHSRGGLGNCGWGDPWHILTASDTSLRPLTGLYRETSASSEFIAVAETSRRDVAQVYGEPMDQWGPAWAASPPGAPIDHETAATALGASWYVFCDSTDTITTRQLTPRRISGVGLAPHPGDDAWHRDAVGWWAGLLTGEYDLEDAEAAVPTHGSVDWDAYPPSQAAAGVSLLEAGESFAATAQTAGWAWIRVPWDPYWHSHDGTPVLKGGPGHIVAWIDEGRNDFGWWVPRRVDIAAIATTTTAVALALTLLIAGRRRSAADPWSRSPILNCRPTAPQPAEPDRGASPTAQPDKI